MKGRIVNGNSSPDTINLMVADSLQRQILFFAHPSKSWHHLELPLLYPLDRTLSFVTLIDQESLK